MGVLEGRVAAVTGGGRGIGAAVARALASEGASVVVNDLGAGVDGAGADRGPADECVADIRKAGGSAVAHHGDVTDGEAAEDIIQTAVNEYGRLDVLVNVAGILRDRMVFNLTREEWDAVVNVHMTGTFNTTRAASIYWRAARHEHSRLINFTSGSGLFGAPGQPNYAAAKMGIVGFTYSCANALGRYGVTANAIAPAAATRMTASIPATRTDINWQPGADPELAPENVATPVVYIASERSDWLTGRVIGAQGYRVSLYNNPEVIREVSAYQAWDIEGLSAAMERSFKPAVGAAPLR